MSSGEQPLDVAAVRADDQMIERIRGDIDSQHAEELELLLREERRRVGSRALPVLVTVGDAVQKIRSARRRYRWLNARRWLVRIGWLLLWWSVICAWVWWLIG